MGDTHVGPCGMYVDTWVAEVAIAWRASAWRSGPHGDFFQLDWELSRASSRSPEPPLRASFVAGLAPLQPLGLKSASPGQGAGGMNGEGRASSRLGASQPFHFLGVRESRGFFRGRFYFLGGLEAAA